jgi:hypothetical protein
VYLAPGGMGQSEVDLVLESPEFAGRAGRDQAQQASWEGVAEHDEPDDPWNGLIRRGLVAAMDCMEAGRPEKYKRVGERAVIADVAEKVAGGIG